MDEALDQVPAECRAVALRVHALMSPAATIATEIWRTSDHGLVLEYENNITEREVTLTVNAVGKEIHFVTNGGAVGSLLQETGVDDFARWLKGGQFPTDAVKLDSPG